MHVKTGGQKIQFFSVFPNFQGNWVFATITLITISLEPNIVHLWYFFVCLKYLRSTTFESKDIGFRKAEYLAKTQFLS